MSRGQGFAGELKLAVTCASGLEKTLKSEIKRLGYGEPPAENGTLIAGNCDALAAARLNLNLRTADRVYIVLAEFRAESFDELFEGVSTVRFEDYIPKNGAITVNGKCVKSKLFSISDCQKIVKKAIATRLCKKYCVKTLPESGAAYDVEFSIYKDAARIMLNTSGAGLHKRGYRDMVGIAPIRETLAAGLVLMSDYYKDRAFADPFCGSGTIAIEAAKIALNIAGGAGRSFAFEEWDNFDDKWLELAKEEAKDRETRNADVKIFASDIDPKAIKLAKRHAERAGVADKIEVAVSDVAKFKPFGEYGTIVTNPPYGERVYDKEEAEACYKKLFKSLKGAEGWSLFLITAAKNFERVFGKKADREKKLFNSNKECRFYYYYGKRPPKGDFSE